MTSSSKNLTKEEGVSVKKGLQLSKSESEHSNQESPEVEETPIDNADLAISKENSENAIEHDVIEELDEHEEEERKTLSEFKKQNEQAVAYGAQASFESRGY